MNFAQLRKLFSNLAPYADDIARGISNYGDDFARLASNYGDDLTRVASTYGDDLGRYARQFDFDEVLDTVNRNAKSSITNLGDDFVELNGKAFHYPTGNSPQQALKGQLLTKRTGLSNISDTLSNLDDLTPIEDFTSADDIADYIYALKTTPMSNIPSTDAGSALAQGTVSPDTYVLGDVSVTKPRYGQPSHFNPKYTGNYNYLSDDARYTLPVNDLVLDANNGNLHLRPHKNTALSRWFKNQF